MLSAPDLDKWQPGTLHSVFIKYGFPSRSAYCGNGEMFTQIISFTIKSRESKVVNEHLCALFKVQENIVVKYEVPNGMYTNRFNTFSFEPGKRPLLFNTVEGCTMDSISIEEMYDATNASAADLEYAMSVVNSTTMCSMFTDHLSSLLNMHEKYLLENRKKAISEQSKDLYDARVTECNALKLLVSDTKKKIKGV